MGNRGEEDALRTEMKDNAVIYKFFRDQLSLWPDAAARFRALKDVQVRELEVNGLKVRLQYNPARIVSTSADVSKSAVKARPCFLCSGNRPEVQKALQFDGRKGRRYDILVNPYPIFPFHLTVASSRHEPQSIRDRYVDMLDLAHHYTDFTFFYNGPHCGASAPDHLHFQACPRGMLPLETEADRLLDGVASSDSGVPYGDETVDVPESLKGELEFLTSMQEAQAYHFKLFTGGVFLLRARTSKSMAKLFYRLLDCADTPEGESEPMFNLLTWYKSKDSGVDRPLGNTHGLAPFEYRAAVMFRAAHRSSHYFSGGADHLMLSPGCADMAGLFVVPREEDFRKLDAGLLKEVLSEVSSGADEEAAIIRRMTRTQRNVEVGIMSGKEIRFEIISDGAGPQKVSYEDGKISYDGVLYDELYFDARTPSSLFAEPTFMLYGVTIGVDFHWERNKTFRYAGALKFIVGEDRVIAVNVIGMEDYLLSVISSEMKADAPLEFLKAHAVISRSWLMAVLEKRRSGNDAVRPAENPEGTYVRWFDREDHELFDVCSDDHCQRYQGVPPDGSSNVRTAVDSTWGMTLRYEGDICDTRFSKCCGGVTEVFSTCWEDRDYPYLRSVPDTPGEDPSAAPFCSQADEGILSSVLNDYDLETKDFYRWSVEYDRKALSGIINRRSGMDFGELLGLVPVERGPSGRISKLRIIGAKKDLTVGKELIIRKFLSESHLKSSAFELRFFSGAGVELPLSMVERAASGGRSVWERVRLDGKGWGHGVGLCQIGAAVMSEKGYGFKEILQHYYPGAKICM